MTAAGQTDSLAANTLADQVIMANPKKIRSFTAGIKPLLPGVWQSIFAVSRPN
jgi:hypothetical protein